MIPTFQKKQEEDGFQARTSKTLDLRIFVLRPDFRRWARRYAWGPVPVRNNNRPHPRIYQ